MIQPDAGRASFSLSRDAWLGALAMRYREPLVRYFTRKGVPSALVEDCTQEVFLRLARADQQTIDNAEAYLFTIASSVVITRARKAKSHREAEHRPLEDFSLISGEAAPDRVLQGKQAIQRLVVALAELPTETREMFLLNREDGLTYTQIAARYAIGVKVVERHIVKALNHVRQRFSHND